MPVVTFQVDGRVDGRPLNFMIDTGAYRDRVDGQRRCAARNSSRAAGEFVTEAKTANGSCPRCADAARLPSKSATWWSAMCRLSCFPDEALSDNLLGLSFLSRLKRFEYSDGKLVLEQ